MSMIDPAALGTAIERVSSPATVLISSLTGVVLMALGVGSCGVLSIQTMRAERASMGTAILGLVMAFSIIELAVMLVDVIHIAQNASSLADITWLDIILVAGTYQCTSIIAYASQWFFGLRVYQLYPSKRFVCVPIFITAHVSLVVNLVLCIKGYSQPRWNASTSLQALQLIAQSYHQFLVIRERMQIIWICSAMVCDVFICALILSALLRMKTFLDSTQGVIRRLAFMTSHGMLPPMLMAALWAGIIASRQFGPGSWFRNLGPLQSLLTWSAILWSIRMRKSFLEMLNPPRPPPPTFLAHDSPAMSIGFDLEPVSCTLIPDGSYAQNLSEKMDMAAAYSSREQLQVLTIDEALRDPNRDVETLC